MSYYLIEINSEEYNFTYFYDNKERCIYVLQCAIPNSDVCFFGKNYSTIYNKKNIILTYLSENHDSSYNRDNPAFEDVRDDWAKYISEINREFKELAIIFLEKKDFEQVERDKEEYINTVRNNWKNIFKYELEARDARITFPHKKKKLYNKNLIECTPENRKNFYKNSIKESQIEFSKIIDFLKKNNEDSVNNIIDNLYSITIENKNIKLPFFKKDIKIKFPFRIERIEDDNGANFIRPHDSLYEQRKGMGATLYNGNNFSLNRVSEDGEIYISKTDYFSILDSADYMSSRIKTYFPNEKNEENEENFNKILDIWKDRANEVIKNNNFIGFNSGFAFSIPIFEKIKTNNGIALKVLTAKNSSQKGTGYGKNHISPAGMFEYWEKVEFKNGLFTFDNFLTIAIKELLEETIFGGKVNLEPSNSYYSYLQYFIGDTAPQNVSFSTLKNHIAHIIKYWDDIWKEILSRNKNIEKPNNFALLELSNVTEQYFMEKSFFIIDSLNLRPEIILPIYIENKINNDLNWEYDENSSNYLIFNNKKELLLWTCENFNDWSSPGLAAVYLGAEQYFNKPF